MTFSGEVLHLFPSAFEDIENLNVVSNEVVEGAITLASPLTVVSFLGAGFVSFLHDQTGSCIRHLCLLRGRFDLSSYFVVLLCAFLGPWPILIHVSLF